MSIEVNDRDVVAAFNRLLTAGQNPREMLDAVGLLLKRTVMNQFETSTDPYGTPWKPLKSREGGKPLVDRGNLKDSITYQVDGNMVTVGTNHPFAQVHQYGATIVPKPGKFWQTQHTSVGKRGSKSYTVTQPAKLAFMVNGHLVFANKVTIPARPMFPLAGLPPDWSADIVAEVQSFLDGTITG